MTIPLQSLFEEIQQAKSEDDLQSHLVTKIGAYFTTKRSAIFFFDRLNADRRFQGVLDVVLSSEYNPIANYIIKRHTPVHEGLVTTRKAWKIICPRPDHWHVMAGPIVDRGKIVGVVGCTREQAMPSFDQENLIDLSAICLHLSVWASTMRPQQQLQRPNRLTPREWQIAELVALGRTNAEIGAELWITENSVKQALKRMFRKLDVSSRVEMVGQLFVTTAS